MFKASGPFKRLPLQIKPFGMPEEDLVYESRAEQRGDKRRGGAGRKTPFGPPSFYMETTGGYKGGTTNIGTSSKTTTKSNADPKSSNAASAAASKAPNAPSPGSGGNQDSKSANAAKAASEKAAADKAAAQKSYGDALAREARVAARQPGHAPGVTPGNQVQQDQREVGAWANELTQRGIATTQQQLNDMIRTTSGEAAGETPLGRDAVANTMFNRQALSAANPGEYSYLGGPTGSWNDVLPGYDANGLRAGTVQNDQYKATVPGTPDYADAMRSVENAYSPYSSFNKNAPPALKEATHYFNPSQAQPGWGKDFSQQVGNHLFGNAEATNGAVVAARDPSMLPTSSSVPAAIAPQNPFTTVAPAKNIPIPRQKPTTLTGEQPTLAPKASPWSLPDLAFKGIKALQGFRVPGLATPGPPIKQFADAQTGFGSAITGPIANHIVASKTQQALTNAEKVFADFQNGINKQVAAANAQPQPASSQSTVQTASQQPDWRNDPAQYSGTEDLPNTSTSTPSFAMPQAPAPSVAAPSPAGPPPFERETKPLQQVANKVTTTIANHPVAKGVIKTMHILDNANKELFGMPSVRGGPAARDDSRGGGGNRQDSSGQQDRQQTEPEIDPTTGLPIDPVTGLPVTDRRGKNKKKPTPVPVGNTQLAQNKVALFGSTGLPEDWYARQRETLANEMRALGVPF